jgi:UDP-N-acetylglucosamine 2-epimerase (hydrolysing)
MGDDSQVKKILFITGTRADYGKIKPLMKAVEQESEMDLYIYVSGMHLLKSLGNTYKEVLKDGFKNVFVDYSQANTGDMSYDLGDVVCHLTNYVSKLQPDAIVVHGDRIDALAGALVGAIRNIRVVHIEGGELSGTIDESIRHAISKFSHIHMVCNEEAKKRLIQLGEEEQRIFIIGSPDIDIMLSEQLPSMDDVRNRYDIDFDEYAIAMYHPVTTEISTIGENIKNVVDAFLQSGKNYVVIFPNNDYGSDIIINEYERLKNNKHFRVFPSLRFEYFLTLLKNADFFIGNSSGGVRETGIYGIPSIDLGTRQKGRYGKEAENVLHTDEDSSAIIDAIEKIGEYRKKVYLFGEGNSSQKFTEAIRMNSFWQIELQKKFVDYYCLEK